VELEGWEDGLLIAVLSDTHLPARGPSLPPGLVERLNGVDRILHAGDLTSMELLAILRRMAPVSAVHGNVDDPDVKLLLPRTRIVEAGGFRIGLVHGDGAGGTTLERARRSFREVDCVVFGHSHSPHLQWVDGILMLNPGSPTDPRREPRGSFALLRVGSRLEGEIIYI